MKRILGVVVCGIAVCGCGGGGGGGTSNRTQLRFIHLLAQAGAIDVLAQSASASGSLAANVAFGATTGYRNFSADTYSFFVRQAGTTNNLGVATGTVPSGGNATVYAIGDGRPAQPTFFAFLDDRGATPSAGNCILRFLNAAARSQTIDIYVTASSVVSLTGIAPTIDNLDFAFNSVYANYTAGSFKVWVTEDDSQNVLQQSSISASSGFRGTVIIADDNNGTNQPFSHIFEDKN